MRTYGKLIFIFSMSLLLGVLTAIYWVIHYTGAGLTVMSNFDQSLALIEFNSQLHHQSILDVWSDKSNLFASWLQTDLLMAMKDEWLYASAVTWIVTSTFYVAGEFVTRQADRQQSPNTTSN